MGPSLPDRRWVSRQLCEHAGKSPASLPERIQDGSARVRAGPVTALPLLI